MLQKLPTLDVQDDSLARRILAHWHDVLGPCDVASQPYQYFYCDRIWPADVYARMLQLLPPHALYRPLNIKQWVNASGISTRDKLYLSETLDRLNEEQSDFWRQIVLALTSTSFKDLVFSKLKEDVSIRLGIAPDDVVSAPVYVGISLTRDIEDYYLKPHPDGHPRVVTAQFYLPADESQRDLGTSIYEKQSLIGLLGGSRFKEVKRMPFMPNSGYAFAVNECRQRQSYHGRELIKSGSGVRNSILMAWRSENSAEKTGELWPIHNRF
jgi:hypothetical protein